MCRQLRDRKSPSGLSRHSFRLIRYHAATATPGGCHVPLPAGRIDGGVSSGSKDASPDKLDRRVRAASWPPYPRPAICSEYKASPIRPRRIGEFRSTGAGSYPRSHDVRSPTPSTIRVRQLEERRSADVIVENLRPLAELSRASVVVRTAERVAAADQRIHPSELGALKLILLVMISLPTRGLTAALPPSSDQFQRTFRRVTGH